MNFVKMHGTGNDFVIFDHRNRIQNGNNRGQEKPVHLDICQIANRKTGIGCDQVIFLNPSFIADCLMQIYNADGSQVEMCGNAARCVGDLLMRKSGAKLATIELGDRILTCTMSLTSSTAVTVDMGVPKWQHWQDIPLAEPCDILKLPIRLQMLEHPAAINIGNPHAVFFVGGREEFVQKVPLEKLGPLLENHALFPQRANIEVAEVISDKEIKLRIWERGVGETESCGSGACAAVVAATLLGHTGRQVLVKLLGGELRIEWDESTNHLFMTGEVAHVFQGIYNGGPGML